MTSLKSVNQFTFQIFDIALMSPVLVFFRQNPETLLKKYLIVSHYTAYKSYVKNLKSRLIDTV